jgi:hypothetical protein
MHRKALIALAAVALAAPIAGNASAANARPTVTRVGGGVQTVPGGIVKDKTGGYYNPARGIYIPGTGGIQSRPGGIVRDKSGGYYDPARSTYIPATVEARSPTVLLSPRSFSWADATVGAAVATGTILALLGAALLATRRRGLPA